MKNETNLETALKNWEVNINLPSHFHAEIWQRIADRSDQLPWWNQVYRFCINGLPQPRYAAILIAFVILIGVSTSQWRAHQTRHTSSIELEKRYAASINPYLITHPTQN